MKFKLTEQNKKNTEPIKFDMLPLGKTQKKSFFRHWRLLLGAFFSTLIILLFIGAFTAVRLASWFDTYSVAPQNPIVFAVQKPFIVRHRLPIAPIPKATFIEVNPLTTPQQIVDAARTGSIPQYANMSGITPISKETIRDLIHNKVVQRYGETYWNELDYIITHESDYNPYIVNKNSGACGIFQALSCTKLPSLDITDQIYWGLNVYIPQHYNGSIDAAYAQKKKMGWY